jgi:hypothetical protein
MNYKIHELEMILTDTVQKLDEAMRIYRGESYERRPWAAVSLDNYFWLLEEFGKLCEDYHIRLHKPYKHAYKLIMFSVVLQDAAYMPPEAL